MKRDIYFSESIVVGTFVINEYLSVAGKLSIRKRGYKGKSKNKRGQALQFLSLTIEQ